MYNGYGYGVTLPLPLISSEARRRQYEYGVIAQLVARLNGIQEVTSSNLVSSTTEIGGFRPPFFVVAYEQ